MIYFVHFIVTLSASVGKQDIRKIQKLKFTQNQLTNSRFAIPSQQLKPFVPISTPLKEVICDNQNEYPQFPLWECYSLNIRLTEYVLQCEGWSHPNDFNIVKDSCFLEFRYVLLKKDAQVAKNASELQTYVKDFESFEEFYSNGCFNKSYEKMRPINQSLMNVLQFSTNNSTTSLKTNYKAQLAPMKGSAFKVDSFICKLVAINPNLNFSYQCFGFYPNGYVLEKAEVSCEGWDVVGDIEIVPGSCRLEYLIADSRINGEQFNFAQVVQVLLFVVVVMVLSFIKMKKLKQ